MDDGPFAFTPAIAGANFDADGFHDAFAGAGAVAWGFVDVLAVQACGAVVAVFGAHPPPPRGLAGHLEFAVDAGEAVRLVSTLVI